MKDDRSAAPCPLAQSDAAYVLGALSPAERLEFERHLAGCASCRRSVAQLAGLPGLLGRLSPDEVEDPPQDEPLPDTLLPALVGAVRREHRRRTILLSLGAAAAIIAVALGVSAVQGARDDDRTPVATPSTATESTVPAQAMTVVHDYGMRADVSLTSKDWGTEIDLLCTYVSDGEDYGSGATYFLVVRTHDGSSNRVASWKAIPGKTVPVPAMTFAPLEDIAALEVRSHHGKTILRLDL